MKTLEKVFGGINLTWPKVIIMSIVAAIYTAAMCILPIAKDTSFSDIGVTFEVWILFGIFIITNSKSGVDSMLKCFVFFLISQPLIYLIQVPFSSLGWQIFGFYRTWFIWTLLTIPMGFIGWYMKKNKWWGLIILLPILALLGKHFGDYLGQTIYSFPYHVLTTVFCFITMIVYPIAIFKDKKIKLAGLAISIIIMVIFGALTVIKPSTYDTIVLVNNGSEGAVFDDTYTASLEDESFGTLDIRKEPGLDDWVVHAVFKKQGSTKIILKSKTEEVKIYTIEVGQSTYTIKEKQ